MSSAHDNHEASRGERRPDGAKRALILNAATDRFGRDGYEDTKWADIATDVGVGPTALYHYFESKQHCLFVIMAEAVGEFGSRFDRLAAEHPLAVDALVAIIVDCFRLSERDV